MAKQGSSHQCRMWSRKTAAGEIWQWQHGLAGGSRGGGERLRALTSILLLVHRAWGHHFGLTNFHLDVYFNLLSWDKSPIDYLMAGDLFSCFPLSCVFREQHNIPLYKKFLKSQNQNSNYLAHPSASFYLIWLDLRRLSLGWTLGEIGLDRTGDKNLISRQ